MKEKSAKRFNINHIITQVLRILLIASTIYSVYLADYVVALGAFVATIISFIPSIIKRNYKVAIPWIFEFFIVLFLLLHVISTEFGLYDIYFWSWAAHFTVTVFIAILAFTIVYTLDFTKKIKLSIGMIGFFTIILAIAVGATWEIGEFFSDNLLGTTAQSDAFQPPLIDTMWDLVFDTIAGIVAAILGMIYVKYDRKLGGIIKPFIKIIRGEGRMNG